jgi:all-trans-retinol 13,14-reductase
MAEEGIARMAEQFADNVAPGAPTKAGNFGLIAWVLYIALAATGHWRWALFAGAIVTALIVAIEYRHHAVKITDATALVYFAVMWAVSMAIGTWLINGYNVLIVWAVFGIVFWTTIAVGFPFTLQFAREQTPPAVWHEPVFIQTNYRVSLLWAVIATINAALGSAMHFSRYPMTIGAVATTLLLVFGIVASGWYGKHVAAQYPQAVAAAG